MIEDDGYADFIHDYVAPEYNKKIAKYGMILNPDVSRCDVVFDKLAIMQDKYGKEYCPCQPQRTEDTVCPCKNMRELHACKCGLYVRKGINNG